MNLGKFLLYTTLGAGAWNMVLAFLGFYLIPQLFPNVTTPEQVMEKANQYSHIIGYVIAAAVVLVVVYLIYKVVSHKSKN